MLDGALKQNGLIYAMSTVRIKQITDGLSKTYLLGERHIPFNRYDGNGAADDDQGWGIGWDRDVNRTTNKAPNFDQNDDGIDSTFFGSAHLGVFHMGMCDGS